MVVDSSRWRPHLGCRTTDDPFCGRRIGQSGRIASLSLKGGGQEGVGRAPTALQANDVTAARSSRRAGMGYALALRLVAAPTPSCPPPFRAIECTHLRCAQKKGGAEQRGRSGGERAAACSAVKATPSGRPAQVRAGLDRRRSRPHSAAMIDTSVRGSSVPRLPHTPTSGAGALDGGWSNPRRASWWAANAREGSSRTKRCRSWRPLRQRAEAVKAAANFSSRHREAAALTAEHAAARSPPDRPLYPADSSKTCESDSPFRGRDANRASRSILRRLGVDEPGIEFSSRPFLASKSKNKN